MHYFCPNCFAEIPWEQRKAACPRCHTDAATWQQGLSFDERLIHALKHPNPTTRMMTIITLGNHRLPAAADALVACAFASPSDVVQDLEIIRSLNKLPDGITKSTALRRLTTHPAKSVRRAARASLGEPWAEDPISPPEPTP